VTPSRRLSVCNLVPGHDLLDSAELIAEINGLRDAQTGRRIVRDIIRTDQAFPGERSAYLPDLIVRWDASAPITAASSSRAGKVSSQTPDTDAGNPTRRCSAGAHARPRRA
jgi:hypothetical protein